MEQKEINKKILKRLDRLETAVFGNGKQKKRKPKNKKEFKGMAGGLRVLISEGFFKNQKKIFTEIKKALNKEHYYSSRQAVQVALNGLSTPRGPLIKIKEGKKNYYAERK